MAAELVKLSGAKGLEVLTTDSEIMGSHRGHLRGAMCDLHCLGNSVARLRLRELAKATTRIICLAVIHDGATPPSHVIYPQGDVCTEVQTPKKVHDFVKGCTEFRVGSPAFTCLTRSQAAAINRTPRLARSLNLQPAKEGSAASSACSRGASVSLPPTRMPGEYSAEPRAAY